MDVWKDHNFSVMRELVEQVLKSREQALVWDSGMQQIQHSPSNEKRMLALFRMPQLLEHDPRWYPLTRVMTASTASYRPHTPTPSEDSWHPL